MIPEQLKRIIDIGWYVMPVSRYSKCYCIKPEEGKTATDYYSNDISVISDWTAQFRDCNWRVHMGASGLFALDIDRESELHDANGFKTMFHLTEKIRKATRRTKIKDGWIGWMCGIFQDDR